MVYLRICRFLKRVIDSDEMSHDLVSKCVELMLRIGLVSGSAEALVAAAHYQMKLKIDISRFLKPFLGKPEKFTPIDTNNY